MKKGTQAPASMIKPVEGSKEGSVQPAGKKLLPFAGAPKPGKMVKK
jgi:hypothetical protein